MVMVLERTINPAIFSKRDLNHKIVASDGSSDISWGKVMITTSMSWWQKNLYQTRLNSKQGQYLVRDIKPPNHQSCFSQLFYEFFSVWAVEKENKLFVGLKLRFFFWTNKNFVFFFNCLNWDKFVVKLGKTRLVVWCHEQVTSKEFHVYKLVQS